MAWTVLSTAVGGGAQRAPVPVTLHVTNPNKAVLRNASVGIAAGPDEPFSFYKSDAQGNVTISLTVGGHDLRVDVSGYPLTYEHVEVAAPATVPVVLGHGTASKPAQAMAAAPNPGATQPATATTSTASPRSSAGTTMSSPTKSGATKSSTAGAVAGASLSGGANPLQAWTSCYFPDGLQILAVDPLAAGVTSRTVDTADGSQQIDLVAGVRVMLAWPFTDYFANVKAEEMPADRYAVLKAALLANLAYLESQPGGPEDAQSLPANLHGFEVHGNNRDKLEGSVLGMYLLFDDPAHVAATIYFLNQESWRRKFQTMEDYARLRDQFLTTYTGCVRQNQAIGR